MNSICSHIRRVIITGSLPGTVVLLLVLFVTTAEARPFFRQPNDSVLFESRSEELIRILEKNKPAPIQLHLPLSKAFRWSGVVTAENISVAERLHKKYSPQGSSPILAALTNEMGCYFLQQQDYPKSLEYLLESFRVREELKSGTSAVPLQNIAVMFYHSGNLKKAIDYLGKAAESIAPDQQRALYTYLLLYKDILQGMTGDPSGARESAGNAYGGRKDTLLMLSELISGMRLKHDGKVKEAQEALKGAGEKARTSGNDFVQAVSALMQGRLLVTQGDTAQAIQVLLSAGELDFSVEEFLEKDILLLLADCRASQGDYAAANKNLARVMELNEEMTNGKSLDQRIDLELTEREEEHNTIFRQQQQKIALQSRISRQITQIIILMALLLGGLVYIVVSQFRSYGARKKIYKIYRQKILVRTSDLMKKNEALMSQKEIVVADLLKMRKTLTDLHQSVEELKKQEPAGPVYEDLNSYEWELARNIERVDEQLERLGVFRAKEAVTG